VGLSSRVKECCVVLDTNVLMLISEGRNIFEEIDDLLLARCKYVILDVVLNELRKIAHKHPKSLVRRKAKNVLQLLESRLKDKYIIVSTEYGDKYNIDDIILEYALARKCYIASNDRDLRRKARQLGVPEIYLRKEKQLFEASKEFI